MKLKPSVFAYNNFRLFLSDYQLERQKRDPKFTKSEFSRLLGLPQTRSYFFDVLRGKKVTPTFVERFITILKCTHKEAQFFRILVLFNQSTSLEERELYFDQLIRLNQTPRRKMDASALEYYRDVHNGVIRALLAIYDFDGDYKKLGSKVVPPVSAKKARDSIALLQKLKLVASDTNGAPKPTDRAIFVPETLKNEMIMKLQCSILDQTQKALMEKRAGQVITTNTISISKNGCERIRKHIHKFRSEIRAIIHKDENRPEQVYQFVLGFFPASH
jgi:uncharacterized protein (TIGR02147 family)